jgi:hypothetical protein
VPAGFRVLSRTVVSAGRTPRIDGQRDGGISVVKRGWGIVGVCLGLGVGVAAGSTLFADENSVKGPVGLVEETVLPLQPRTTGRDTKFVEIEPARVFDSRQPAYPQSGPFAPNTSRVLSVANGRNAGGTLTRPNVVPTGATAIAYNVTVTGTTGPNFLAVTPGNVGSFTASAINFNGTADVANAGIVSIDTNRQIRVWNGNQSGSTHVIIDVTGYFVKPLYAQVTTNGSFRNGSRVVSTTRLSTGYYKVTFDRDILDCGIELSLGQYNGSQNSGVIDFRIDDGTANTVSVFTQANDGVNASADRAFNVVVTC